jgi:hypothetical protein
MSRNGVTSGYESYAAEDPQKVALPRHVTPG